MGSIALAFVDWVRACSGVGKDAAAGTLIEPVVQTAIDPMFFEKYFVTIKTGDDFPFVIGGRCWFVVTANQ